MIRHGLCGAENTAVVLDDIGNNRISIYSQKHKSLFPKFPQSLEEAIYKLSN